jgi:hypothetical protein
VAVCDILRCHLVAYAYARDRAVTSHVCDVTTCRCALPRRPEHCSYATVVGFDGSVDVATLFDSIPLAACDCNAWYCKCKADHMRRSVRMYVWVEY